MGRNSKAKPDTKRKTERRPTQTAAPSLARLGQRPGNVDDATMNRMFRSSCNECGSSSLSWMAAGELHDRVPEESKLRVQEGVEMVGAEGQAWSCDDCGNFGIMGPAQGSAEAGERATSGASRPAAAGRARRPPRSTSGACRQECGGEGADRTGADLIGALLRGSDLRAGSLRGAYLIGADLRAADLSGAAVDGSSSLTQPQLEAARGVAATTIPPALTRPRHWPTSVASLRGSRHR